MANNESQKLAVDVIARINQLEKSMAKASTKWSIGLPAAWSAV